MKLLAMQDYADIVAGEVYECQSANNGTATIINKKGWVEDVPLAYFVVADDNGDDILDTPISLKAAGVSCYLREVIKRSVGQAEWMFTGLTSGWDSRYMGDSYVALPVFVDGELKTSTKYVLTRDGLARHNPDTALKGDITQFTLDMQRAYNILQREKFHPYKTPEQEWAEKILGLVPPAMLEESEDSDVLKALKAAYQLLGGD